MFKFVTLALCACSIWAVPTQIKQRGTGGRIIGGSLARAGQFPFVAAIYVSTGNGIYFCSGALISADYILTAGTCVDGAVLFNIRLGTNDLNANDPSILRLATDIYFLHPDFVAETFQNDVGIIQFRLPITFTDYIKPIGHLSGTQLPPSSSVFTVGWGQTDDQTAGIVDELNYVFLTALSNEDCTSAFGSQVTQNMVCVDGNFNEGTCRGDSGSPLIQYAGQDDTWHVGISSFISTNGCESTDPSGFTRTSIYRDWIRNITGIYN